MLSIEWKFMLWIFITLYGRSGRVFLTSQWMPSIFSCLKQFVSLDYIYSKISSSYFWVSIMSSQVIFDIHIKELICSFGRLKKTAISFYSPGICIISTSYWLVCEREHPWFLNMYYSDAFSADLKVWPFKKCLKSLIAR